MPTPARSRSAADLMTALDRDGWALVRGGGDAALARLLAASRATIIHTTDVIVRPRRALITSREALDLHTDHHRAQLIAWTCIHQGSEGGHTQLADGRAALSTLDDNDRATLTGLSLVEHDVFGTGHTSCPVLSYDAEGPRLYCSFWFGDEQHTAAQRLALSRFRRALEGARVLERRLEPDDLLVVDNGRVLHGRSAITGTADRHLVRRWLGTGRGGAMSAGHRGLAPTSRVETAVAYPALRAPSVSPRLRGENVK